MLLSDKTRMITRKSIIFLLTVILCLIWMIPLFFMVIIALKTKKEYGLTQFWEMPGGFNLFENIKYVLVETKMTSPFLNSLFYSVFGAASAILISSLAAYGITKLNLKGGFAIFLIIWSGMIFPIQIYLIPMYKAYLTLNLYNTRIGLIMIYCAVSIPFCVFVFRNYFGSMPQDYHEAAKIEGCTKFQIYRKIIMPNALGPIAVLALFQGSFIWNDLILGMVLTGSQKIRPVMNALALLNSVYSGTNVPAVMTANLMAALPVIVLYLALQKYFIQGLKLQVAGE